MTQDAATVTGNDQRLAGRIATLMRWGTASAAALLIIGVVLWSSRVDAVATIFLTGGCAVLVALPAIKLVLMGLHFARTNRRFVPVTALALVFVLAAAAAGLWL